MNMHVTPEQRLYSVLIRVRDLARMRWFYSDVVGLGAPVVDSNFWVEFQNGVGTPVLALIRDADAVDGATCGKTEVGTLCRVAACLSVADLGEFERRISEHDVPLLGIVRLPSGGRGLYFSDPEGNLVLAVEPVERLGDRSQEECDHR